MIELKCPICKDGKDYLLDELEAHLTDDHDMKLDEREQFGEDHEELIEAQIELENSYDAIRPAIEDSLTRIEKHDSHVTLVEIHGPHSGFLIEFQGHTAKYRWKRTSIEK